MKKRALGLKNQNEIKSYDIIDSENQFISFKMDDTLYCIQNNRIKEFYKLNKTKITSIPCTPSFIKGVVNIRGEYIPVIDIKNYFSRGKTNIAEKSTIIIVENKNLKIGLLTDGIGQNIVLENIAFEEGKEILDYVKEENVYSVINIENVMNNEKIYIK